MFHEIVWQKYFTAYPGLKTYYWAESASGSDYIVLLQILIISQDYDNKKDGIFLDGISKKMEKKIKKEENGKKDGILLCLLFKKK